MVSLLSPVCSYEGLSLEGTESGQWKKATGRDTEKTREWIILRNGAIQSAGKEEGRARAEERWRVGKGVGRLSRHQAVTDMTLVVLLVNKTILVIHLTCGALGHEPMDLSDTGRGWARGSVKLDS